MATVYLAEDLKHHRRVAIKVLKPELAAALGPERFLREIDTAARLTHPHILALHDSGQAGGSLYYVMPYIEGESLRDRLEREGPLPLEDALRITREVADALSYAHDHDVVHRDIKPENILFQAAHAVVSDFGIARAITAAAGGSLTATGIAIGTPAYMSPEQATGSSRLDGRSDIYGLGCVLYEMLAGEPPYTGPTAQVVMAKRLADPVPSVRRLRETIPPTIDAAVSKALAKAPADRFATAAQFAEVIRGRPERAPLTHLVRTAALFGLASVVVLGVVYALMVALGLPDWVFGGAIVLLLLGLPVVSVTGLVEGRRARAATGERPAPPSGGLRAWFTWRRSVLGGVFAFSALGLVTAAYMAMRLLGIGPVGTLIASGVIKNREPVILVNFQNRAADSTLGPSLTEAFRVDLSESPTVKLMDPEMIASALRRMERLSTTPLDGALGREIAQRENVKAVVIGEIDPLGKGYVLSASLVVAADGSVLAAVRETAENDAELIGAIDRLSRRLRERIGESLKSIRATEALERVTTASLDALRKYTAGVQADDAGRWDEASALLEEATALDPGFAMAYRKLSVALDNSFATKNRVEAAATKAFAHRDRLPVVERDLSAAWYYDVVDYDPAKVISAYGSVLQRDPENATALNNLSWVLNRARRYGEAESLALHATKLRASYHFYANALAAEVAQGHFKDVQATLEEFARALPQHPWLLLTHACLASTQGDYATAERLVEQLREAPEATLSWKIFTSSTLAAFDEVQGRLTRAEQHLRDNMAENEQRGLLGDYLRGAIQSAWIDLRYRNREADGVRMIEAALQRHPLASMSATDRPYVELAAYYAHAGRPDVAKHWLAEFQETVPVGRRRGVFARHDATAEVALAEGRFQDAIGEYRAWHDEAPCATCGWFEVATTYERTGMPDSALAVYERIASTLPLLYDGFDRPPAPTLQRLGELYEARGNRARARHYYSRFIDLWKHADQELQPRVAEARAAFKRLSEEHR